MRLTLAVLAASLSFASVASAQNFDNDCNFTNFNLGSLASLFTQGSLGHTVYVPATNSATANGQALMTAVASIKSASANNPYVIKLDAGTYSVPSSIVLLPYISLKGAGMTSTILTTTSSSTYTVLFFQDQILPTYKQALSNETVSDMTIVGIQPLSATVNGILSVDHVMLKSTQNIPSALDLITVSSLFFVTSSQLGPLQLDSIDSSAPPVAGAPYSSILSSEIDLDYELAPTFKALCIGSYDKNGNNAPRNCNNWAPVN